MNDFPRYNSPIPTRATKSTIMEFAEQQRSATGLQNGFQLPELVKSNGGELSYIGFLDDDQTDAIIVEPDNSFRIRLSSHTGALRDNFTIAHELGHLLLHWPLVRDSGQGSGMKATRRVEPGNTEQQRCEWEANWFASAFLMPKDQFTQFYRAGTAAAKFGVTQSAVEVRAKTLDLT